MMISEKIHGIDCEFNLETLKDLVNKLSASPHESFKIDEYDGWLTVYGNREATAEEQETILRAEEAEKELRRQNKAKEQQRIEKILLENPGLEYVNKSLLSEISWTEERRQALALSMTAPLGDFVKDGQIVSWVDLNQSSEPK